MKRKLIITFSFIIILLIISSVLFKTTKKNNNLTHVRIADTAITSWT